MPNRNGRDRGRLMMNADDMANMLGHRASRRSLLKATAGLSLAVPGLSLLAACGGDDDDDTEDPIFDSPGGDTDDDAADEPADDDTDDPDDEPVDEPDDDAADEPAGEPASDQHGGTLTYAISRAPTSLDAHINDGATSWTIQANVYNKLVDYDEDGSLTPSLATDWEIEDDVIYRFDLREGVTFHNGEDFTADDVVFSIDRILDPETAAALQPQFDYVDRYEAIDDHVVEIELGEPFAPFLSVLAHWAAAIVSREFADSGHDITTELNGTGPFMQDAFETDVSYRIVRNPDYWDGDLPYLDAVDQRVIEDDSARISAIQAGDVEFASYTPWQVLNELDDDPNFQTYVSYILFNCLRLNPSSAPLDDPLVRRALSCAVDRDAIHNIAFGGRGLTTTGGLIPPDSEWHNSDLEGYYEYDPERAIALLAEAGYDDPSQLQLNLRSSTLTIHLDSAEIVAQQLREIGLQIELETQDVPTLTERRNTGDYQIMFDGLSPAWEDPDFYSVYFQTGGSGYAAGVDYSNPELDELFDQARQTVDTEERREIYRQVEEMILEDAPMVFLFWRPQAEAMTARVQGYTAVPNLGARSESYLERVWLEES